MTPDLAAQVAAIRARHDCKAAWMSTVGLDINAAHDAHADRAAALALLPAVWDAALEAAAQRVETFHPHWFMAAPEIQRDVAAAIRALPRPPGVAP